MKAIIILGAMSIYALIFVGLAIVMQRDYNKNKKLLQSNNETI